LDNRISSVRAVSADARIDESRYAPLPAAPRITFYKNERFVGQQFTTEKPVRNFERIGFNDRISSVRAISADARISEDRYAPLPVAVAAQIIFFEREQFQGRTFTTAKPVGNFERFGFNDRASSVEVLGERWEVCENAGFRGRCVVLRPGRYASLAAMGLNDRVSSVRAVRRSARVEEDRYAPAPVVVRDGRDYRRRNSERTYEANVTSVRAVVATPTQKCWVEAAPAAQSKPGISVPGAVVGAVIGGILGHQIGGRGTSQDVATVGGAAVGGFAGANIGRLGIGQQAQPQNVQRCENVPSQTPTYYDVTYNFRGQDNHVQMTAPPGPTVTVNERGEPRE